MVIYTLYFFSNVRVCVLGGGRGRGGGYKYCCSVYGTVWCGDKVWSANCTRTMTRLLVAFILSVAVSSQCWSNWPWMSFLTEHILDYVHRYCAVCWCAIQRVCNNFFFKFIVFNFYQILFITYTSQFQLLCCSFSKKCFYKTFTS